MDEEWRPIVGGPNGYDVSNRGNVRSWRWGRTRSTQALADSPRPMKQQIVPNGGHLQVRLHADTSDHYAYRYVHQLVLEAFVGPRPEGLEARHLDGNPKNNVVANLAWGTNRENKADMIRHGTDTRGARNARAKLTNEQVAQIRASKDQGRVLARRFGVSESVISLARRGKTYKVESQGGVHAAAD
jgi:hypothetical protein